MYGESLFQKRELAPVAAFTGVELGVIGQMLSRGINSPLTSSAGRLFDAFASLAGLRQRCGYEGQAAIELEGAADGPATVRPYRLPIRQGEDAILVIDWEPAVRDALGDLRTGAPPSQIAHSFHDGLAAAIAEVARRAGERTVVLTGGCFQNARLTERAVAALRSVGLDPVWHRLIPPNDGGLALGQAVWAGWMAQTGGAKCV